MPEYLSPGVYIEEATGKPKPIKGVDTTTAAFIGETERGPTTPKLVTNYSEYLRWFGGVFGEDKFMPYAVRGFFENGGTCLYVCRIVADTESIAEVVLGDLTVRAVGPGTWGKRIYATMDDCSTQEFGRNDKIMPTGFRLRVAYYNEMPTKSPAKWFMNQNEPPFPDLFEVFDDLATDKHSENYWKTRIRNSSVLVELFRNNSAPLDEETVRQPVAQLTLNDTNRNDISTADFEGNVQGGRLQRQGLAALELDEYRDVALIYAPGANVAVNRKIISHCEAVKFRFALVDPDKGIDVTNFQPRSEIQDSQNAALYYPWIVVADSLSGRRKLVPPGGHVLGVYVRTDIERGTFKSPANESIREVLDLEVDIDNDMQKKLNQRSVNIVRRFPERGIRVWGARTLSSDSKWQYVNVSRLLIFLEHSIKSGTQWAVFEQNNERLWARVIDSIYGFLHTQWQRGALFGKTADEAFFVTCDSTTMTQDDILNGRLICHIGIAPVRPAEFVIIRIFQQTAQP